MPREMLPAGGRTDDAMVAGVGVGVALCVVGGTAPELVTGAGG
jgi:hypothetical protein